MPEAKIICVRGKKRTICDVCDGTRYLRKKPWRGRQIDMCVLCEETYDMEPSFRAWADKVIATHLGVPLEKLA